MNEQPDLEQINEEYRRQGLRMYGIVSGGTLSVCFGVFATAMAVKPESSVGWAIGAVLCFMGAAGSAYEVWRYARGSAKAAAEQTDNHPPKNTPPIIEP